MIYAQVTGRGTKLATQDCERPMCGSLSSSTELSHTSFASLKPVTSLDFEKCKKHDVHVGRVANIVITGCVMNKKMTEYAIKMAWKRTEQ